MKSPTMQEATDWCRRLYTVPAAMDAYLTKMAPVPRLYEAYQRLSTAKAPHGKFGLDAADTAAVATHLDAVIHGLRTDLAPMIEEARRLRRTGVTMQEVRNRLSENEQFSDLGVEVLSIWTVDGRE